MGSHQLWCPSTCSHLDLWVLGTQAITSGYSVAASLLYLCFLSASEARAPCKVDAWWLTFGQLPGETLSSHLAAQSLPPRRTRHTRKPPAPCLLSASCPVTQYIKQQLSECWELTEPITVEDIWFETAASCSPHVLNIVNILKWDQTPKLSCV